MIKYSRYGKFRFSDYYLSWITIVFFGLFSILFIVFDLNPVFSIFSMGYAVFWLWRILYPQREKFMIQKDQITVFKGKRISTIELPLELMLVLSYADVCPPFAVRTSVGNPTHILKDKISVSILTKMPVDSVVNTLHQNYIQKYTMSRIQSVFDDFRYVYSFVCNQDMLNQLFVGRKCSLIIPKSLKELISFDSNIVDVYIYDRC
jgi:hypothetical protein